MYQPTSCDTDTQLGLTCNGWSQMFPYTQYYNELPSSTIPVVWPGQDCWVASKNQCVNPKNVPITQTCDMTTQIGKTCNGWSWMDTSQQRNNGLPSTIDPVYPGEDCWVASKNRCVTLESLGPK